MSGRGKRGHPVFGALVLGALSLSALFPLAGCAHGAVVSQSLADMDHARLGPDVKDSEALAPQQFAHAESERAHAHDAEGRRDPAGADLYAERAVVAYERAVVLARLARATTAEEMARGMVAKEEADAQRLAASRVDFEKAADAAATELAVAREARVPARVGPADASRERARLIAAHSLAAEGHLLCSAARLLARSGGAGPTLDTTRLDAAEHEDDEVIASLAHPVKATAVSPVEAASHARVACLDALTRTRRTAAGGGGSGDADALLSALSARGGWDPSRDERGVIVTLRGVFRGNTLVPAAEKQLRELGLVAANRAPGPVQVVLHDATAPSRAEQAADQARVQAALDALALGVTSSVPSHVETVGALLPVADPSDPQGRARNARLEIVFVARSE